PKYNFTGPVKLEKKQGRSVAKIQIEDDGSYFQVYQVSTNDWLHHVCGECPDHPTESRGTVSCATSK
uniref:Uncharacterized protein n=1 Tax=Sinocyclocheilus rhinocerous TaxID=307959 RepID=A0A673GDU9_9TELE